MNTRRLMLKMVPIPSQWVFLGVALLLLSVAGCTGRYGKFVYDDRVDQLFKKLTVLPDHRYYFSGPDSEPDAIIAIDKRYTLKSNIWKPVEMTSEKLKHWIDNPARRARLYPYNYGRYIVSDDGQRIGLWYSLKDWRAFAPVKMLNDTTVQVSTPIDEAYRWRGPPFSNNLMDDD